MASSATAETVSSARAALADRGFVVLDKMLDHRRAELMDVAKRIVETSCGPQINDAGHWDSCGYTFEGEGSEKRLYKVQGVCLDRHFGWEVLDKVFADENILKTVRELFGIEEVRRAGGVDVFGTKFYPVWPRDGRSVGWHQDSHYFGSQHCDGRILSFGIYLEDTNRENGCLRVVPGSHRALHEEYPHVPDAGDGAPPGEWIDDRVLDRVVEEAGMGDAVDVEVPACSVVVFDAKLVHGARANRSETRSRFSFFGHFVRGDIPSFEWRGKDFSRGKYADRHQLM